MDTISTDAPRNQDARRGSIFRGMVIVLDSSFRSCVAEMYCSNILQYNGHGIITETICPEHILTVQKIGLLFPK